MCVADLEDELIRCLGAAAVEQVVQAQGELGAFRTFQKQPSWRGRTREEQLRRFLGTHSGRKITTAPLLVEALDPSRVPRPLDRVLAPSEHLYGRQGDLQAGWEPVARRDRGGKPALAAGRYRRIPAGRDRQRVLVVTTAGPWGAILAAAEEDERTWGYRHMSEHEATDLFRLYLDEIGRHPLLTKQDEVELSQAYEAGLEAKAALRELPPGHADRPRLEQVAARGMLARRRMIESNLRLVVSIARRFSATGLPLGDLVQEGNLGLLRAVEKFDWRKGFKFSTYATWWIRQAIVRGAADRGARAIRLPVHVDEKVGQLRRARARLQEVLEREPTDGELAADLDLPVEKVSWLKETAQTITSLDTPVGDDGAALQDFLEDDSAVGPDGLALEAVGREALEQVLNDLPERERQVLVLRFGLDSQAPRTLEEVGAVMGFSRERARQVEMHALAALRSPEVRARLEDLAEGVRPAS